jgi:WD40 repeat protein
LRAREDYPLQVFDSATGTELEHFPVTAGRSVTALALSPDGRWAASVHSYEQVRIWDVSRGVEVRQLEWSNGAQSLTFSPDGKRLAGGGDKHLVVWEIASGRVAMKVRADAYWVMGLAFSPDGRLLTATCSAGALTVWDAATGAVYRRLRPASTSKVPGDDITLTSFLPDGRLLSVDRSGLACVWDLRTGRRLLTLEGQGRLIYRIVFSRDGKRALTGNKELVLWNLSNGEEIRTYAGYGRRGPSVTAVAFTPDGKLALVGYANQPEGGRRMPDPEPTPFDGQAVLWDVARGKVLHILKGHSRDSVDRITAVAFSHDGKYAASACSDRTVRLWQLPGCRLLRSFTVPDEAGVGLAFSPNGQKLLTAGRGPPNLWDSASGKLLRTMPGTPKRGVATAAFFPSGKRILVALIDEGVKVWEIEKGKVVPLRDEYHEWRAVLSPDGTRILTGGLELKLWDARTGKLLRVLGQSEERDDYLYTAVAFGPNGRHAASAGGCGRLLTWDVESGKILREFIGKGPPVWYTALAFSPDARLLLAGGHGGALWLWDTATGKQLRPLPVPRNR